MDLRSSNLNIDRLWSAVEGLRKQEAIVTNTIPSNMISDGVNLGMPSKKDFYDDDRELLMLQSPLDDLVIRRTKIEYSLSLVTSRSAYLAKVVQRWESLCTAHLEVNPTQSNKKSKSSRSGGQTLSEAPCGFDVRLVWDDKDWEAWLAGERGRLVTMGSHLERVDEDREEDGVICLLTRRKCDRHTGWQKMREADYEGKTFRLSQAIS